MEVKSNVGKVAEDTEKLAKATKKSSRAVKKLDKTFGNLLKATGFVTLLVKGLDLLLDTFKKNQKVVDVFNTVMNTLSIIFNDIVELVVNNVSPILDSLFENPLESIKEFGIAITEGIYDRFIELLDVFGLVGKSLVLLVSGDFSGALDTIKQAGKEVVDVYTGVDESFDDVAEAVVNYTTKVVKAGVAMTNTAKAAKKIGVIFEKQSLELQAQALIQEEIRDNELLSIDERYAAIEKLSEIQEKQNNLEKDKVQTLINAAELAFKATGSDADWIELQRHKNDMMKVEATILASQNEIFQDKIDLNDEWNEANLAQSNKDIALAKKTAEELIKIEDAKESAKMKTLQMGFQVAGKLAKENSVAAKGIAIAGTIFNTQQSIMKAMADVPYPYNIVQSALNGIMGAQAIATIMSTNPTSPSGGGGGGGGGSATPAPQMMSGAFDISGGVAPEATRAYVVTDEMSNSQAQLANIRRRATI